MASAAELRSAVAHDPVVAAHYAAFDLANARVFQVQEARSAYVSYRRGDDVFWTSKKLRLAVGETLITDGQHISRTRCGNQISDEPRMPVSLAGDPEPQTLDTAVPYEIIEPFVASIGGEIGGGGIPANAVPLFALACAGGGVGGTIGGSGISAVPIIPATGGVFPGPGSLSSDFSILPNPAVSFCFLPVSALLASFANSARHSSSPAARDLGVSSANAAAETGLEPPFQHRFDLDRLW